MLAKHQHKHEVINVARSNVYIFRRELIFLFWQKKIVSLPCLEAKYSLNENLPRTAKNSSVRNQHVKCACLIITLKPSQEEFSGHYICKIFIILSIIIFILYRNKWNFMKKMYVLCCDVITYGRSISDTCTVLWHSTIQTISHNMPACTLRKLQSKQVFHKNRIFKFYVNVMIVRDTIKWFIPLHRPSTLL